MNVARVKMDKNHIGPEQNIIVRRLGMTWTMNGTLSLYSKDKHPDRLVNPGGNGINFLDGKGLAYYSDDQAERPSRLVPRDWPGRAAPFHAGRQPRVFGGI